MEDDLKQATIEHAQQRQAVEPFVNSLASGLNLANAMPTVYMEIAARLAGAAIASLPEEDMDEALEVLMQWIEDSIEHHVHYLKTKTLN